MLTNYFKLAWRNLRKQRGFAVATGSEQCVKNEVQGLPVLVRFAVRQDDLDDFAVARAQGFSQALRMQRSHCVVADNGRAARNRQAFIGAGLTENISANHDLIAALVQRNVNAMWCGVGGAHDGKCGSLKRRWDRRVDDGRHGVRVNHTGQFQLREDHRHQHRNRGATGGDVEVSGFTVERIALCVQLLQTA